MNSTGIGYCMKCRARVNVVDVKQEGESSDGKPKLLGRCESCGIRMLCAWSTERPIRRKQHQSLENMAALHSKSLQAALDARNMTLACPNCKIGAIFKRHEDLDNPLNDDISCFQCGYSGPTVHPPHNYLLTRTKSKK
jgi:predicted RNA-binding Zn-ribbon protein involved in translation (DUF1610 family)/DNA-directed RNA polymerase subunit RPC12/RpoP